MQKPFAGYTDKGLAILPDAVALIYCVWQIPPLLFQGG